MSWRRFIVNGVFWRQLLRWGVRNLPPYLQPFMIAVWALIFLVWGPGRRGVVANLKAIKPGSSAIANIFRCYRVFLNFAWTIADNARFKALGEAPDWKFVGFEHLQKMQSGSGAILLTAHMGNYDLGAHIFAETSGREIVMVRAPETDPDTRAFEDENKARSLRIEFNTDPANLAFELLEHVRAGEIVAIQGDRVTEGIASTSATLFGKSTLIPAGPFALAMAAQVPIYPIFIVREGYRSYTLISCEPIAVTRTRDREAALAAANAAWTTQLEAVVSRFWFQWFTFAPFAIEGEA